MLRAAVGIGVTMAALLGAAAPAVATYAATQNADGVLLAGDTANDTLVITVGDTTLAHNRFGDDPGFASAEDFDSATVGVQPLASTYATRLTVDGGTGQDSLDLADGRLTNSTQWLHAGQTTPCVQETVSNQGVTALCYRAATLDVVTLDGGPGDDRISSLDGPTGTILALAGGDGDDSLSQDGEDGVHMLNSRVDLIGGPGTDEVALTEDQPGSLDYNIGNAEIRGTGYAPVSYDSTAEFVTLYTRLGPDNNVSITEKLPFSISIWSAGGTIRASGAGSGTDVIARPSLFDLDDQGPINFRGGLGDDVFFGTDGDDVAKGGKGIDQLNGEGGRDRLNARDRKRDLVDCGKGRDKAKTDRKEASLRGCEVIRRPG